MRRIATSLLGLTLCYGIIGCDTGGPPVGTPADATGSTAPPGFEDMMKKTGGAMGNPGAAIRKESKEAAKTPPKEKEEAKPAAKEATK